jgi:hypothetical protein
MSKKRKPPSLKKIRANIENSKKSKGPTSTLGKWRSSQNPIVHALYAKTPVLMFESAKEREELAEVITSNLRPFTPVQEFRVGLIINRVWLIMRNNRTKAAYMNYEVTTEVIARSFPPGEYSPSEYDEKREEILDTRGDEIVPTDRDVENVLHRLFEDRHDLILKMDKMSLQNEKALTRLLDDFVRLRNEEIRTKKEENKGYEPRLGVDPWDEPQETPSMHQDWTEETLEEKENGPDDGDGKTS